MTIRFQADVNLNQIIVRAVCRREPALDFQTAETADLAGLPDPEVLARAAEDGRILVTHDLQTMPRHLAALYHHSPEYRAPADSAASADRVCCRRSATHLVDHGGGRVDESHVVSPPVKRPLRDTRV